MLSAPVLTGFFSFFYNYAIKLFIDAMSLPGLISYGDLLTPIVLFLSANIILDVIWRISSIAEWKAEPYVRRSIVLQTYDYVQRYSYTFFQNTFTGTISSKLKGILDGYDKFWSEMHHGLGKRIFACVVNLGALSIVNFHLSLFVFGWCFVYIPIMYKLSKKLNKLAFVESECRHSIMGQISDKITNIFTLFAFTARDREYKTLDKTLTNNFIPLQVSFYKYDFKMQIIGGVLYFILFFFLIFYMIHLRIEGVVSVGDFAFVFGIVLVVGDDIWHATVSMQDFSRSMGDLKSALSILDSAHYNPDPADALNLSVKQAKIEFKNVRFGYDDNDHIIRDLNLTIKPGEKIGLVGHSGAGKTSLINLLLRYFHVDNGTILIDDQDISVVTQDSIRSRIAVIPQETLLFHRSLFENISYGKPEATFEEVVAASTKAHLHDFIETLPQGYETEVGERGLKLSGGQRQRIAIARAILKNAPILILDEATSSLDSQTEKLIQDALNILIEDKQKTVIAIAHRLSTLKHMDRIIVLDKGCIAEEGTHNQLIRRSDSLYKKLWELQEI
jgi:ATP-binding cassette subfamily B protein